MQAPQRLAGRPRICLESVQRREQAAGATPRRAVGEARPAGRSSARGRPRAGRSSGERPGWPESPGCPAASTAARRSATGHVREMSRWLARLLRLIEDQWQRCAGGRPVSRLGSSGRHRMPILSCAPRPPRLRDPMRPFQRAMVGHLHGLPGLEIGRLTGQAGDEHRPGRTVPNEDHVTARPPLHRGPSRRRDSPPSHL